MDHIKQLKQIRSEAIARMRNSPDFKLAGKLGLLIVELGEEVDDTVDFEETEPAQTTSSVSASASLATPLPFTTSFSRPNSEPFADLASDEMIDELVAEIEGDAAELDAIMAEQEEDETDHHIGPFMKPTDAELMKTNGAAH